MSQVISRLPNSKDGLIPATRRILFSAYSVCRDKVVKSGLLVSETLKFHPHGDQTVYNTIVNLAQPVKNQIPLLKPQGNFGSVLVDYNSYAAPRYTEITLSKFANTILFGPEFKYVPKTMNYTNTVEEPLHLPTMLPLSLLNGVSGIAVGYAANYPSHNILEVINLAMSYVKTKRVNTTSIFPDFKSGGYVVYNKPAKFKDIYKEGRGRYYILSKYHLEPGSYGRTIIVVDELPNGVSAEKFMKDVYEYYKKAATTSKPLQLADLQDYSSGKTGIRIVLTLKKTANVKETLKRLYDINSFMKANNVTAIFAVGKKPKKLSLHQIVKEWYTTRIEDLTKYFKEEIKVIKKNNHNLIGFEKAMKHRKKTLDIIYSSRTTEVIKKKFKKEMGLDGGQVEYILEKKFKSQKNKMQIIREQINENNLKIKEFTKNLKNTDQFILDQLQALKEMNFEDGVPWKHSRGKCTKILRGYKTPEKYRLVSTGFKKFTVVIPDEIYKDKEQLKLLQNNKK